MSIASEKWNFNFEGASIPEALAKKAEAAGILNAIPETKGNQNGYMFAKDFFTADGYPAIAGLDATKTSYPYIFPALAPWYTGATFPEAIVEMDALYRQTACEAAAMNLFNLLKQAHGIQYETRRSFNGIAFLDEIEGEQHLFAFPDTRICPSSAATGAEDAAVILIADSYENNADWEKTSGVPLYARQQALLQLWCWDRYKHISSYPYPAPQFAYIVRICGNLPSDCIVRTVYYNPAEAESLVRRICKARTQEPQKGLYWKRNTQKNQAWREKLAEAYCPNDDNLYDLVAAYMKTRTARKTIEREIDEVSAKMEAIAVILASRIPSGYSSGKLDLPDGKTCTVTHQRKRTSSGTKIPAELVCSFFPQLDNFVIPSSQERETVTIDVC